MIIFAVYEEENCYGYSRDCGEGCFNSEQKYLCKTYEIAKTHLDRWIFEHPGCVVDDLSVGGVSNAICYYDQEFCKEATLVPISENEYLKNNDFGGYKTCFIVKKIVEED